MKVLNRKMLLGLAFAALSTSSVLANDYSGARYQKINICAPYKGIVFDLQAEVDSLNPTKIEEKIKITKAEKYAKEDHINELKKKLDSSFNHKQSLEARLDMLTNNMGQVVADINGQIAAQDQAMSAAQAKIRKNQRKKDDCRGGMLGTFCRKKYRGRIKDAERDFNNAKARKANLHSELAGLPAEKQALPGKISQAKKQVKQNKRNLVSVIDAKPTVTDLNDKIARLYSRLDSVVAELRAKTDELKEAEDAFHKCKHMRQLAKAYPVMQKHAMDFKNNPSLCQNLDSLMNMAKKPAVKKGILDAHQIACGDTAVIDNGGFQDGPQYLDKIIESPMGSNGEYLNNFRSPNYQPKFVDKVGEQGVKEIRFNIQFDIEERYDFLQIKDAHGNVIEKIDGSGEKQITIQSSHVEFFFYSDGRTAGKGFLVDQIELIK